MDLGAYRESLVIGWPIDLRLSGIDHGDALSCYRVAVGILQTANREDFL